MIYDSDCKCCSFLPYWLDDYDFSDKNPQCCDKSKDVKITLTLAIDKIFQNFASDSINSIEELMIDLNIVVGSFSDDELALLNEWIRQNLKELTTVED